MLGSWDGRVAARAATVALLALALAWLVTAATDEGGVPWGDRLGRALPVTPLCAALGTWAALGPVRARGEALALGALGWGPGRVGAGAVAGGAAAAVLAAVVMLVLRRVDVAGFYPTAAHASDWLWQGVGFVDRARGLGVEPDGAIAAVGAAQDLAGAGALPAGGRAAAALATGVSGVALPMLVGQAVLARPIERTRGKPEAALARANARAFVATGVACAASLVCFQAAAVRALPALVAIAPALALLAYAALRYRSKA